MQNITLAQIWVRKKNRAEAEEKAMELLERVGIPEQAQKFPGQLSGGQQQRVGIARALTQKPKLVLADEPVASLDPVTSRKVMDYIKKINVELGITTIVNLHFLDLAKDYAERIIGMYDGKIVYDGMVDDITDADLEKIYGGQLTEEDYNETRTN
jgi:phosphonate transport system ATP-binding protein